VAGRAKEIHSYIYKTAWAHATATVTVSSEQCGYFHVFSFVACVHVRVCVCVRVQELQQPHGNLPPMMPMESRLVGIFFGSVAYCIWTAELELAMDSGVFWHLGSNFQN
jgi:hypothetical protein